MTATDHVLPTFLGIGSMRCGSTWLFEVLKRRSDVHMSTPKQLQFFNSLMLKRDLAWYADHFQPLTGQRPAPVRGEITPFYSRLSEASVEHVHQLLPQARVVLTIRNPVERVWSHLLYDWGVCKRKNLNRISTISLMNFLHRQRTIRYTDYELILRRWRRVFGEEAVFVELFERIKQDSPGFVRDVLLHIQADADVNAADVQALRKPVYAAKDLLKQNVEIPPAIQWALAAQWLPKVRRLDNYLSGRVSHWVEECESIAKMGAPSWRAMRFASRYVASLPERMAYRVYDQKHEHALNQRWSKILREADH